MTPEKIGRYIILSELGRGGMATVYRAKDPNFDREVAVKVLPRTFLHDPQFRIRFEREARTIAALEHAAIVPVHDFGEDDGQPFIVMRLMSGGSLADKLKEGKIPLGDTVRIISQLASGLDAAHQKGVIHRDLKPGNILFDQYGDPYLSDFGIARLAEGDGTLTGGRILGTPAYMSPEQVQGDQKLDGRSDIYAMGVIFYQMLVGETPFQASTPGRVMIMHVLEPVPDILSVLPSVPPRIEAWCRKVLEKDPDDRFASSQEMGKALTTAYQDPTPTRAEPQPTVMVPPREEAASQGATTIADPTPQPAFPPSQQETFVEAAPPPQVQTPPEILTPHPVIPSPDPPKKGTLSKPGIIGLFGVLGIAVIAVIALLFTGMNGKGPLAAALSPATAAVNVQESDSQKPAPTTRVIQFKPAAEDDPPPTATIPDPTATIPLPTEDECPLEEVFCVGLVTDVGEVDDRSFNQSAWEGVLRVEVELGALVKYIETKDGKDYGPNIALFAEKGYDVIVTVGFAMAEATGIAAGAYPDIDFIGVDQWNDGSLPNLTGLLFPEDQAGFLAGALAAKMSQTGTIAAVLGTDLVPPVVAFKEGYEAGARYVNPEIITISTFHSGGLDVAFTDPEWGGVTAKQAIDNGADVIFGAGGKTGNGAIVEAASHPGVYCIGVDSDQWETVPEAHSCLISSAMKLIIPGVFNLVQRSREGSFPGGEYFGSAGLAPFHDFESAVPQEVKNLLAELDSGLRDGSITTGYSP